MKSIIAFAITMMLSCTSLETAAFIMPHNNFRPSSSSILRTATRLHMSDYLNSLSKPNPYQKSALNNPTGTNMVPYNTSKKVPPKKHTQPPGRETNSMNDERADPYTKKDPTCGPTFVPRPLTREWGGVSPSEPSRLNPTGTSRTYDARPGSLPPANNNEALGQGQDMVWDNNGVLKRGKGGNPGGDLMTWR